MNREAVHDGAGRFAVDHTPLLVKVMRRIRISTESGCWRWTGRTSPLYGKLLVRVEGITVQRYAHRVVYEMFRGPIPDGLTIDHLCRNPPCVNPWHLEPVTQGVNTLRGNAVSAVNLRKTHCLRGHPLFGDNVYWRRDRPGTRQCKACGLELRRLRNRQRLVTAD